MKRKIKACTGLWTGISSLTFHRGPGSHSLELLKQLVVESPQFSNFESLDAKLLQQSSEYAGVCQSGIKRTRQSLSGLGGEAWRADRFQ